MLTKRLTRGLFTAGYALIAVAVIACPLLVVGAAAEIAALRSTKPARRPIAVPADARAWTDDHANLLGAFNGW
jgi:hypothetical protein